MTHATFGVKSSSFLATQVLNQLEDDYSSKYPEGAKMVKSNFYIDDCVTGAIDVEEACKIQQSLTNLLLQGKMTLRKLQIVTLMKQRDKFQNIYWRRRMYNSLKPQLHSTKLWESTETHGTTCFMLLTPP